MSPEAALAVSDLQFAYRQTPVIIGARWTVAPGSVVALLGLSGAGKSTLLELAAGVLRPSQGTVRVMGGDPAHPATRKLLGYMPQGGGLYPDLTVEDNLRIFGEGAGLKLGSDVDRVLEFLELRKRRTEVVAHLPMGWQKRVSLGAALITQAPVLLLDEPLAHADAPFTTKAWAHFRELAAQGRTLIVATSAPPMAAQADRVALMRAGRLAAEHETAALAAPGRARVVLTYQKRSATRTQEVEVADYRQELVRLVQGGEDRPFEVERLTQVELKTESLDDRLARLLTEEA